MVAIDAVVIETHGANRTIGAAASSIITIKIKLSNLAEIKILPHRLVML